MPALTSRRPFPDYHAQDELRTINFTVDRSSSDVSLGFNIRGGAEFGLGIFVSGVSEGSIAERAGFVVGDEIIAINGTSFEGFTHEEAVDLITSNESLSITVRSTGRIPEEEQRIGKKHNWIALNSERIDDRAEPDYLFATEDLYPTEGYYDSDNSLDEAHEEQSRDFPIVYQETPWNSPPHLDKNRQTTQSKGIPPKKTSQQGKMRESQVKKNSKKLDKKQQNSMKGSNIQDIGYERDQLVNMVIDKIQLDFTINECGMIRQSIAMYHDGDAVEDLLTHILGFFTPRKYELLREIRKVVYADEVGRYDAIVSGHLKRMIEISKRKEMEALENKGYEPEISEVERPADEIVMHPVKTSYKSKESKMKPQRSVKENVPRGRPVTESAMVMKPRVQPVSVAPVPKPVSKHAPEPAMVMKPMTRPAPEPIATMVLVPGPRPVITNGHPIIKPYVPFIPEPYVLYDKDKNPIQKLVHGVRVPQNTTETPAIMKPLVAAVIAPPAPAVPAIVKPFVDAIIPPVIEPVVTISKSPVPVAPAPAPIIEPVVTIVKSPEPVPALIIEPVVTVSKSTERVPSKKVKGRKESIEIKKTGKDNTTLSVRKTSVQPDGPSNLLTIENSSFDKASNTITIDATLNMDKPVPKINVKTVKTDSVDGKVVVKVPVNIEKTTTIVPIVEESSPRIELVTTKPHVIVEETLPVERNTAVKNVAISVEKSPSVVPVVRESLRRVDLGNTVRTQTYNIDKSHRLIGLSISGGVDSRYQREIRIVSVNPDSAAALAGLKVGQELLCIDEHSLTDKTHEDACRLIRSTFRDKKNNIMVLTVQ